MQKFALYVRKTLLYDITVLFSYSIAGTSENKHAAQNSDANKQLATEGSRFRDVKLSIYVCILYRRDRGPRFVYLYLLYSCANVNRSPRVSFAITSRCAFPLCPFTIIRSFEVRWAPRLYNWSAKKRRKNNNDVPNYSKRTNCILRLVKSNSCKMSTSKPHPKWLLRAIRGGTFGFLNRKSGFVSLACGKYLATARSVSIGYCRSSGELFSPISGVFASF